MALKSSREGLRKELVDYLGNLIIDDNLRNEIIKLVGDNFVTSENLNEAVNNLTIQITTENGERIEADTTLQNNITAEATAREEADTTLQNNINAETTARQEAITNLEALIEAGGLQMDLLWTNASPTSSFNAQTISIDFSSYKEIVIVVLWDASLNQVYGHYRFIIDDVINLPGGVLPVVGFIEFYARSFTLTKNQINFADTNATTSKNNFCIPYKIYGIK